MLRKTFITAALMIPMFVPMFNAAPVSAAVFNPMQASAKQTQININTADAEQLAYALTGVGIKRAKDIIKLREELGQFSDVNQLMQVKGIGPRMLELNKERIIL